MLMYGFELDHYILDRPTHMSHMSTQRRVTNQKELQDLTDSVIERNSFFALLENLLLAMFTHERGHIVEYVF